MHKGQFVVSILAYLLWAFDILANTLISSLNLKHIKKNIRPGAEYLTHMLVSQSSKTYGYVSLEHRLKKNKNGRNMWLIPETEIEIAWHSRVGSWWWHFAKRCAIAGCAWRWVQSVSPSFCNSASRRKATPLAPALPRHRPCNWRLWCSVFHTKNVCCGFSSNSFWA